MGKAKKTRKFAEVKRMLIPKTLAGGVQKKNETKEVVKHVYVVFSIRMRIHTIRCICRRPGCARATAT